MNGSQNWFRGQAHAILTQTQSLEFTYVWNRGTPSLPTLHEHSMSVIAFSAYLLGANELVKLQLLSLILLFI